MTLLEQKTALLALLQTAMDLELATIPPYMTALLSIRPGANRLAANHIRSVLMEEMLHMALVGNLMYSLGGQVQIGGKRCPSFPMRLQFEGDTFQDRQFDIHLARFSQQVVETFMQVELPTGLAPGWKMQPLELIVPGIAIGDFYDKIESSLNELCSTYAPSEVFVGEAARQVGPEYFWGALGRPIVITSLADAKAAIDIIVRQGEGADLTKGEVKDFFAKREECPHYFRFKEIAEGRQYLKNDSPFGAPQGEEFAVDYAAVYPIVDDPKQASYPPGSKLAALNSSFNRQYSIMLTQLELAFNGNPQILYEAINNGMHGLASIALEMMDTKISKDSITTGAPSYEWVDTIS